MSRHPLLKNGCSQMSMNILCKKFILTTQFLLHTNSNNVYWFNRKYLYYSNVIVYFWYSKYQSIYICTDQEV